MTTPRYLFDTDICIFLRRQRPAELVARVGALDMGEAAISIITYGELVYGVMKNAEPDRARSGLERLTAFLPVLPLPGEVGDMYGEVRAKLAKRGELIGTNDLWIAAHALVSNLVLVTNNEREFRRIPSLKVENWA